MDIGEAVSAGGAVPATGAGAVVPAGDAVPAEDAGEAEPAGEAVSAEDVGEARLEQQDHDVAQLRENRWPTLWFGSRNGNGNGRMSGR